MKSTIHNILNRITTRSRLTRHICAVTPTGPWVLRAQDGRTLVIRNSDQLRIELRTHGAVLRAANDDVCTLPNNKFLARELARALAPRHPVKTVLKVTALGLGAMFLVSLVEGYKKVAASTQSAMAGRPSSSSVGAGDFRPVTPATSALPTYQAPAAKLPLPPDLAEKIAK